MQLNILLFGITKDIIGQSKLKYEMPDEANVQHLLDRLKADYPALKDLNAVMVAVNSEYSKKDQLLKESDEVALIPPVSGG